MNLSTVATAPLATLKSFARSNGILPTGDLRLKSTWLEAVKTFLTPIVTATTQAVTAATTPEAIQRYKATAIVALRFTYRAFVVSCLLAIALGMSARDAWVELRSLLESENVKFSQPIAVLKVTTAKRRHRWQRDTLMRWETLKLNLKLHQVRAKSAIALKVIQPATELRQRLNAARLVITH